MTITGELGPFRFKQTPMNSWLVAHRNDDFDTRQVASTPPLFHGTWKQCVDQAISYATRQQLLTSRAITTVPKNSSYWRKVILELNRLATNGPSELE